MSDYCCDVFIVYCEQLEDISVVHRNFSGINFAKQWYLLVPTFDRMIRNKISGGHLFHIPTD